MNDIPVEIIKAIDSMLAPYGSSLRQVADDMHKGSDKVSAYIDERGCCTVADAAKMFCLHPYSITRMIRKGKLKASRISGRGKYMIPFLEIDRVFGGKQEAK